MCSGAIESKSIIIIVINDYWIVWYLDLYCYVNASYIVVYVKKLWPVMDDI